MRVLAGTCWSLEVCLVLLVFGSPPVVAWDADLELLDLVEEIPQTFYQFLSLDQDASAAEIKKAYRRLSLSLHPDKNKDEDAENQFRQLVAIYEVLKDEERRQRYDDILVNGLPDWRQPVFYYRRVRKMSNTELGFLLFFILTVGHYAVIWSIYLEKQLDELLSKKKKEKKKKLSSRPAEDARCVGQDRTDRPQDRPHWHDILPLKLSIWLYLSVKNLPHTIQELRRFYDDYQLMKQQQKEEAEAEQEVVPKEKRLKVKKPKVEFPVYEPSADSTPRYDQTLSIEDIEDQMDDWLQESRGGRKASDWSEEELSVLSRLMVKFPGGTPGRWEKISQELGRSVSEVTTKVKQVKDNVSHSSGLVKMSELKGRPGSLRSLPVPGGVMTQQEVGGQEEEQEESAVRRRSKKPPSDGGETKTRGRRQRDFDPTAATDEPEETTPENKSESVWTQNQQKLLELALQQFPRGTTERWDRIAKVVPGRTKEECMIRYKLLVELVQKRKQTKS